MQVPVPGEACFWSVRARWRPLSIPAGASRPLRAISAPKNERHFTERAAWKLGAPAADCRRSAAGTKRHRFRQVQLRQKRLIAIIATDRIQALRRNRRAVCLENLSSERLTVGPYRRLPELGHERRGCPISTPETGVYLLVQAQRPAL